MDPGWYDDPFRRFTQRYHDGDGWTEHVSDGSGVSFVDPSGSDPFVAGPPPTGPAWSPSGVAGPPGAAGRPLASPWARLGANFLDSLIVGIPTSIVTGALFGPAIEVTEISTFGGEVTYEWEFHGPALLITLVVQLAYFVGFLVQRGATPGKMLVGLKVVDADEGRYPSPGAAFLRWLVTFSYILVIPFIVTVVMIFVDPRRQTLHDKAARTIVVREQR
ncbi:RDD family protein [Actinomarinicola tropica]|uniref:DUF2510 domain-containing protein n=1 Tax=Actinomarinicola tropica TaxID=2789776 RepID=A0A5Q2RRZ7_9ACTN|nr:RDD family protein [Actinomarinicola tropica]QGG96927.1 DUF2510 domain-containing protein [Actinomarinicola tropica]